MNLFDQIWRFEMKLFDKSSDILGRGWLLFFEVRFEIVDGKTLKERDEEWEWGWRWNGRSRAVPESAGHFAGKSEAARGLVIHLLHQQTAAPHASSIIHSTPPWQNGSALHQTAAGYLSTVSLLPYLTVLIPFIIFTASVLVSSEELAVAARLCYCDPRPGKKGGTGFHHHHPGGVI